MKWWQLKKQDADLERELRSDLELEKEEQRERGAYPVNRRTGEIGIRMALGAEPGRIARMFLCKTLLPVACGLAVGVPSAAFVSSRIEV